MRAGFRRRQRADTWPRTIRLRDVSLYVDVVGHGDPLVLMHGGPSADLWTMGAFRRCADEHTLVFYDHRCNGRSVGVPVSSMTWENLTEDADALRQHLGYDRWAVLGHSFGGHVALEYALRHPDRVSKLVLLDTGADSRWARENAPSLLAQRGYSPAKVELVRRWFHGELTPRQYVPMFWRIGDAYIHGSSWRFMVHTLSEGGWRSRPRPEALIESGRHLCAGWTVRDRLGEIVAPTLILAGRDDFVFPPECQQELASGIRGSQLTLVDDAGHNPQDERPMEVIQALRAFLAEPSPSA